MFSYSVFKHISQVTKNIIRLKHKADHWSVVRKKINPADKALEHFDDFYKQVFTTNWPFIREGLLAKQKYVAVVNNYGDTESTMKNLEYKGAINVRTLFNLEKEYLQERYKKRKRTRRLERVWKLDKEMDENLEKSTSAEADPKIACQSLQKSIEGAEFDTERLIEVHEGVTSEILYEFVPATKIKGTDENFIEETKYYEYYDSGSQFKIKIEYEYDFHFPEHLNIYTFESGNHSSFEGPTRASTGVLNYYLMDGGSIFPILALDIKPNQTVLDLCAAPGGKSLLALQTLYPARVVSNDISKSRVDRIFSVFKQYLYDLDEKFLQTDKIRITTRDARAIPNGDSFDRILVDVPCSNDRHSLVDNENNMFKSTRIKERLQLPEMQSELLVKALQLVKIGGVVVYSTCSLSPIQNDGVVHMALKKIWEETKIDMVVKDLSPALLQAQSLFKLANPKLFRYGHLILPNNDQNFGPMYFCKLKRVK